MNDARFTVVFTGHLKPGMTLQQVRANLARLCQFTPEALDRIFSGKVAMRSGADRKAAWRCWELFRRAGALCTVEPMVPTSPDKRFSAFCGSDRAAVICPNCQTPQEYSIICPNCGVDMAIYSLTTSLP